MNTYELIEWLAKLQDSVSVVIGIKSHSTLQAIHHISQFEYAQWEAVKTGTVVIVRNS